MLIGFSYALSLCHSLLKEKIEVKKISHFSSLDICSQNYNSCGVVLFLRIALLPSFGVPIIVLFLCMEL